MIIQLVLTLTLVFNSFNCDLEFNYHNYNSIQALLQNYSKNFPTKTYLYSIGSSVLNRKLWVLAISDSNPDKHLPLRPEAKYVGNIHGMFLLK